MAFTRTVTIPDLSSLSSLNEKISAVVPIVARVAPTSLGRYLEMHKNYQCGY